MSPYNAVKGAITAPSYNNPSLHRLKPSGLIAYARHLSKSLPESPSLALVFLSRTPRYFKHKKLCFAVAEILLLIGLSVESGHLKNWSKPRESCLIIREGLFCAAGVLTLMTVFLAAGLYLTALHAQKLFQQQQLVRQQVLETTVLYTSPPGSPPHRLTTMAREDPVITELPNQPPPFSFSGRFQKAI
ncbi:hypothetical protein GOBAR_AA19994 [Gossypium barbadense]|uniref:Uncharacterized protein n=1 Tax=Gossypium barbadense TaxID=3634 RepID=A0A2P5XBF7_GOSBA|nr:hypothetical protein GOBAR_AA19994 [Gossypium barbadense]